jgi:hypothetical protein
MNACAKRNTPYPSRTRGPRREQQAEHRAVRIDEETEQLEEADNPDDTARDDVVRRKQALLFEQRASFAECHAIARRIELLIAPGARYWR